MSTVERAEQAYAHLPPEVSDDCVVVSQVLEYLSAKDLEGGLHLWHEEAEYRSAFAPAEGGAAYVGHAGLHKYFENVFEVFDAWEVTPELFVASDDRILALCDFRFAGKGSDVHMNQAIGTIWVVRDGLVRRGFGYLDVDAAIDAMAAQCGRDRAEIEVLLNEARRAQSERPA